MERPQNRTDNKGIRWIAVSDFGSKEFAELARAMLPSDLSKVGAGSGLQLLAKIVSGLKTMSEQSADADTKKLENLLPTINASTVAPPTAPVKREAAEASAPGAAKKARAAAVAAAAQGA